jgi:phage FluMu protein Com
MKFHLQCLYCGHVFVDYAFDEQGFSVIVCPRCKDMNLKRIDKESTDIFGYEKDLNKDRK